MRVRGGGWSVCVERRDCVCVLWPAVECVPLPPTITIAAVIVSTLLMALNGLHIQSLPHREIWRVLLSTTDVGNGTGPRGFCVTNCYVLVVHCSLRIVLLVEYAPCAMGQAVPGGPAISWPL